MINAFLNLLEGSLKKLNRIIESSFWNEKVIKNIN